MTISSRDLADMFRETMAAFGPGGVSETANQVRKDPKIKKAPPLSISELSQIVGGKVIADLPPQTTNAREMTKLLAGGIGNGPPPPPSAIADGEEIPDPYRQGAGNREQGKQQGSGIEVQGSQAGKGFASTYSAAQGSKVTSAPDGSRGKPITVELSDSTTLNLAKRIGAETKNATPATPWQKFLQGFGLGRDKVKPYSPLEQAKRWAGDKIGKLLGRDQETGSEQPETVAVRTPILDLAKRNAARMAEKVSDLPKNQDPFGTMGDLLKKAQAARERAKSVQGQETFSGLRSEKGYTETIPGPGAVPKTPGLGAKSAETGLAATTEAAGGAEAAEGIAAVAAELGVFTGGISVAVGIFAELTVAGISLTEALMGFARGIIDSNEHLAKWSGQLAIAEAQLHIGDTLREAHMAGATSGTSSTLASQYNELANEFQPIAEDLASIKNIVGVAAVEVARGLTQILKIVDALFGPLIRATEKYLGSGTFDKPLGDFFNYLEHANPTYSDAFVRTERAKHRMRADKPGQSSPATSPATAPPAHSHESIRENFKKEFYGF